MFIFDEVDKMPIGVLDALRPFMDHHSIIDGVDMSRALFILLSNTGGKDITAKTFEAWQEGLKREDLRYADYESLILKGAFNEVGGLKKSAIIDRSVIDLYVPFLPLGKQILKNEKRDFPLRYSIIYFLNFYRTTSCQIVRTKGVKISRISC